MGTPSGPRHLHSHLHKPEAQTNALTPVRRGSLAKMEHTSAQFRNLDTKKANRADSVRRSRLVVRPKPEHSLASHLVAGDANLVLGHEQAALLKPDSTEP